MKKGSKIKTPHFDGIDPQLCINAKLRKLHRLLNTAYQAKFKPYGLQGSMLSILFIIGKQKHINQKTVADMLVLDPSTMSRDLGKLVVKGWVTITKGDDPRHSELELTGKGYALLEKITPIWISLHQKIDSILGKFNIQQIDMITHAIHSNLDELHK